MGEQRFLTKSIPSRYEFPAVAVPQDQGKGTVDPTENFRAPMQIPAKYYLGVASPPKCMTKGLEFSAQSIVIICLPVKAQYRLTGCHHGLSTVLTSDSQPRIGYADAIPLNRSTIGQLLLGVWRGRLRRDMLGLCCTITGSDPKSPIIWPTSAHRLECSPHPRLINRLSDNAENTTHKNYCMRVIASEGIVHRIEDVVDFTDVGPKAKWLARMQRAGVAVPPGFVVRPAALAAALATDPQVVRATMAAWCQELDPTLTLTFAVRSSAPDEDGGTSSMAGQFLTYLGVRHQEVAERALEVCADSLAKTSKPAAVIVQPMLHPTRAGTLFTADPRTGDRKSCVIEVVEGLGAALLSGETTPTRYVLNRSDGSIVRERLAGALLTDREIAGLLALAESAEVVLGGQVDVEWGSCDGEIVMLQCRPITALPVPDAGRSQPTLSNGQYEPRYEARNARPWYTLTSFGVFGAGLRKLTGFGYQQVVSLTDDGMCTRGYHEIGELDAASRHFREFWGDEACVDNFMTESETVFTLACAIDAEHTATEWHAQELQETMTALTTMQRVLWSAFSTMVVTQPQHVQPLEEQLKGLLSDYADPSAALVALTRSPQPLPTTREESTLADIREHRLSGEALNQALDDMTERFGWIGSVEGDSEYGREHYRGRLADPVVAAPIEPVESSKDAAELGSLIGRLGTLRIWNRFHFMRIRYLMQQAIDSIVQRSGIPSLKFATIDELQRWSSDSTADIDKIQARSQGYAAMLAHETVVLYTGNDLQNISGQIRNSLAQDSDRHQAKSAGVELRGDGAGSGTAVGRVRVIDFVADDYETAVAAFQSGEVLVTGMTRPQIAHLCDRAVAIITDEGGITCHAAVISRERAIPAVIATTTATKILTTGDLVRVHGDTGIVTMLDPAVAP